MLQRQGQEGWNQQHVLVKVCCKFNSSCHLQLMPSEMVLKHLWKGHFCNEFSNYIQTVKLNVTFSKQFLECLDNGNGRKKQSSYFPLEWLAFSFLSSIVRLLSLPDCFLIKTLKIYYCLCVTVCVRWRRWGRDNLMESVLSLSLYWSQILKSGCRLTWQMPLSSELFYHRPQIILTKAPTGLL